MPCSECVSDAWDMFSIEHTCTLMKYLRESGIYHQGVLLPAPEIVGLLNWTPFHDRRSSFAWFATFPSQAAMS